MFDWHIILGVTSGVMALGAIIPYIKDILYGTTRPNIFSYVLWALIVGISILAQISSGYSWSVFLLIGDLLGILIVTALCLCGYGYRKYGKVEMLCTFLAVLAIVSWQATSEPLYAIIFAILADLLTAVPTVIKTYKDPWSEIPYTWFIVATASALGIVSSTIFDLPNLLFPASTLVINGAVAALAFFGRKKCHL
jgi:hypothetical protein